MKNTGRSVQALGLIMMMFSLAGCPGGGVATVSLPEETAPITGDGGGSPAPIVSPTPAPPPAMQIVSISPAEVWVEGADVTIEIQNLDMGRLSAAMIGFQNVGFASCLSVSANRLKCRTPEGLPLGQNQLQLLDGGMLTSVQLNVRDSIRSISYGAVASAYSVPSELPAGTVIASETERHVFFVNTYVQSGVAVSDYFRYTKDGADLIERIDWNPATPLPTVTHHNGIGFALRNSTSMYVTAADGASYQVWNIPTVRNRTNVVDLDFQIAAGMRLIYNPHDDSVWFFARYGSLTILGVHAWKFQDGVEVALHSDSSGFEFYPLASGTLAGNYAEYLVVNNRPLLPVVMPNGHIFLNGLIYDQNGQLVTTRQSILPDSLQGNPNATISGRVAYGIYASRNGATVRQVRPLLVQDRADGLVNFLYSDSAGKICAAVLYADWQLTQRSAAREVCHTGTETGFDGTQDTDPSDDVIRLGTLRVEF